MFGKGVYFADCFQKSVGYCVNSGPRFLILSEVALGTSLKLREAKYMEKAEAGTHSTQGQGSKIPKPGDDIVLNNGVTIPLGKLTEAPNDLRTWKALEPLAERNR